MNENIVHGTEYQRIMNENEAAIAAIAQQKIAAIAQQNSHVADMLQRQNNPMPTHVLPPTHSTLPYVQNYGPAQPAHQNPFRPPSPPSDPMLDMMTTLFAPMLQAEFDKVIAANNRVESTCQRAVEIVQNNMNQLVERLEKIEKWSASIEEEFRTQDKRFDDIHFRITQLQDSRMIVEVSDHMPKVREVQKHTLKTHPFLFGDILVGKKNFEVRKYSDRDFKPGDTLRLLEGEGPGFIEKKIKYILHDKNFPEGIKEGYCVLGLE